MSPKRTRHDALDTYRAKRDFSVTPEPSGKKPAASKVERRFVVQRHRATRLHYDFRLEVDGVLVSWAMPKGPPLDPSVRALAVHVEDHPIEYRDFEGVIPGGQYGSGDVIVWDRGTWEPTVGEDARRAIADGEIHFDLDGEKLRGRFVLVRTKEDRAGREQWLMLHKHDEFAQPGWKAEDHRQSVKSGRTNEEVAAAPESTWHGDLPPDKAEVPVPGRRATKGSTGTSTKAAAKAKTSVTKKAKARTSPLEAPTDAELEALDALGEHGTWELQGRQVELTNLSKVLFPGLEGEEPVTKRDLVRYYATVAPVILPYLAERPLNMHRFPNGVARPGFWHKKVPDYAPDWLNRWHNDEASEGETDLYAVLDSAPALAWTANYGAVELHPWTSRIPDVHEPTWAFIDIDPGTKTTFEEVVLLARLYRTGLDHLGVFALPKLTGQRGLHIWIPVEPGYTFDDTRTWVEELSRAVGATVPNLVSWTWQKRARHGLARLDYTQNAINKTLVAPYSVRAAAGAPVSVPIQWDELDDQELRSDRFTLRMLPERIAKAGDPFATLLDSRQRLPKI